MVHTVMMIPAKNFISGWVMVNIGKEAFGVLTLFDSSILSQEDSLAYQPEKYESSIFIEALN